MPIPNVSSKHCPTLNHIFTMPSSHQRNFVRENKQSIRDKSRLQHAKKSEIAVASYAMQSEGQSHFGYNSERSSTRLIGGKDQSKDLPIGRKSTKSHLRQKDRDLQIPFQSNDRLPPKSSKSIAVPKRYTATHLTKSKASNPHTQNVAVQTEEINDELYLYAALKKCASPAFKNALRAKYIQKDDEARKKAYEQLLLDEKQYPPDEGPNLRTESYMQQAKKETDQRAGLYDRNTQNDLVLVSPKLKSRSRTYHFEVDDEALRAPSDVNDQFNVMSLPPGMSKTCQTDVCGSCPKGYHLLSENEREQIRLKLLDRESLLIKQLNSFPLAIATLRVRQSKTRIEHELSMLEQSLRKLTKKKIYVKLNE